MKDILQVSFMFFIAISVLFLGFALKHPADGWKLAIAYLVVMAAYGLFVHWLIRFTKR